jgi:integrase/recombinase XerD
LFDVPKGPFSRKTSWLRRLRKKNGKLNEMPCHHKLEAYLDAYIDAAGIGDDRKGPLSEPLSGRPENSGAGRCRASMSGTWCAAAPPMPGIETPIGGHTFRATGITDYLTNGWAYRSGEKNGRSLQRENHRAL